MCGIVGYVGTRDGVPIVLEGLQRLEYRGYDSAGIAVASKSGLKVHKAKGRIRDLQSTLPKRIKGTPTIGHTRWATHGAPTDENAHPHVDFSGRFAVVHNGIIENAPHIKDRLVADGIELASETDTELVAHLIGQAAVDHEDPVAAVRAALRRVEGAYGLAVLDAQHPDRIIVARLGSPIVLGLGDREMYIASDVGAIVRHTKQVVHLEDGEIALLEPDGFTTSTLDARPVQKVSERVDFDADDYDLGQYEHFLRKEIGEQPEAVERTLSGRIDERFSTVKLGGLNLEPHDLRAIKRVHILGCGSAYYSGEVGAHLIESLARIPASAEPASEYRYRNPVIDPNGLYIAVSQSGETADTLAAVEELTRKGARVLGVINQVGSAIARANNGGIYIHAGPEVSVASSKSFTSTCVAFAMLAVHLGRIRDLSPADGDRMITALRELPAKIAAVLEQEEAIEEAAKWLAGFDNAMFIGRVRGYPIAREGAQKIKEVAYMHAEAYQAAELKHGPLALICPEMPVVAVVPDDELGEKQRSTLHEIKARGGPILAISHEKLPEELAERTIVVPRTEPELDPILLNIPLQLLAYHAALALDRDIDKPRNLAKSVTVE
ncbi:Glucosamine--fructose-6-phosphate aminotransferase [isomerizing] [Patulibacter medicamentivorans]|jgi:glucosamine--fructose-6-phosphate aminotransferase (isomerizing)|uniref:Glutamine--fructose-6-phosphate aminotransferase [isomerizing] n=1 Tax=Patulibacter medicamentivorans TaxID=1097667 RepID=H0E3M6_9ACTN|nr:glutamine--fructose-6-phosphate transaminase (isomerizing) [Patulibacter medicamentivorans]EHN11728.1 Glucosamine--fructose-6-phosphate aminotransferase [isomerizing] [Patulibacter medicamentivorans]